MSKELEFLKIINNTLSDNRFLGDDCAYLDEYKLAISKDCLVEDVHFSLSYMTTKEIAKKAMLVNISDILASGSMPKYALVGLCSKADDKFIKEFYEGINETANLYNIKIIGGDLTRADKISISITILGDYKKRNISKRSNAKENYIVAVSGEFGSSAQGLEELQKGMKDSYFINYHKAPPISAEISSSIALLTKKPYAMMDSSDGLLDCLFQISSKSNIKIDFDYNLIPKKTDNKDFVLSGGEDYSLVICMDEDDFKKIKGLTKIGKCSCGKGVFMNGKKLKYKGFEHFE